MNRTLRFLFVAAIACLPTLSGCSARTDSTNPSNANDSSEEHRFDPTATRKPKSSKSLTLAPDWQPPSPTRTQPGKRKARVQPLKHWGVPTRTVGMRPSDAEIGGVTVLPEPLRPVPGTSSTEETEALASALREGSQDDRGIDALQRFLESHPGSRWAPAIHFNIGSISYRTGYFQDALEHWKTAWELAKAGQDDVSKGIANRALAEYAKMNARIGRREELEVLVNEAQRRTLTDDARVKIVSPA